MKKSLTTAITTALVIGAASTTFAAANPFTDVPSDHWSYDAVAKLAQEGVIEGYGDGTFNGNAHITRYEMAQMVAKAMSKSGLGVSDQALVERLAAEYADELNNLGVRVANLEKKSDNVKIEGLLRLDGAKTDMKGLSQYEQDSDAEDYSSYKKRNELKAKLRLDITAKVNDDWEVKGRLEGLSDLKDGGSSDGFKLKRAYAHGTLFGGADVKLGEFGTFDAENLTNGGLLVDKELSGVEFKFGNLLKTKLSYGRIAAADYAYMGTDPLGYSDPDLYDDKYKGKIKDQYTAATEYGAIQFGYDVNDNLALAAGWHHLKNKAGGDNSRIFPDGQKYTDKNDIWSLGFDYKFNNDFTLGGLYAKSNVDASYPNSKDDDNETSYSVQMTYKGAKAAVPHSYGVWAAYRQVGTYASINPTYDGALYGTKGYELGVDYMVAKNILAKVVYFDGEYIGDGYQGHTKNNDVNRLFGRLEFTF